MKPRIIVYGLPYEVFSLGPDGKISDDDIGNFSE
jgi:hypothetical protein